MAHPGQGQTGGLPQYLEEHRGAPLADVRGGGVELCRAVADHQPAPALIGQAHASGSRQTLITGEAVRMAAAELKEALDEVGGDRQRISQGDSPACPAKRSMVHSRANSL